MMSFCYLDNTKLTIKFKCTLGGETADKMNEDSNGENEGNTCKKII